MNTFPRKNWWIFLVRGIFALAFGLLALILPDITLNTMLILSGAFIFMQSLSTGIIFFSIRKSVPGWQWMLLFIVLCMVAGLVIIFNPFTTAVLLMYLLGTCILLAGLAEIIMAIRLRKMIKGEGWYILTGIFAVLFAFYIFLDPARTFIILTILFGVYAIVAGILLIYLAFRLKKRYVSPLLGMYAVL